MVDYLQDLRFRIQVFLVARAQLLAVFCQLCRVDFAKIGQQTAPILSARRNVVEADDTPKVQH
jgi:hypothetical protein